MVLWWEALLSLLPYSILGNYCRSRYWARKLRVPMGDLSIFPGVRLSCLEALEIGQGVCINYNVIIDPCEGFIGIGDNVLIGPNCVLTG